MVGWGRLVAVGGAGVGVGCSGVSVGGVVVEGSGVMVGGIDVSVGGIGVSVGRGVSVGMGVEVGGTVLVADGTGVNVGLRVFAGSGVAVRALDRKLGALHPELIRPKAISASRSRLCLIRHHLLFNPMVGVQAGAHYSRTAGRRKHTLRLGSGP